MHILAVSGLHIGVIHYMIMFLFKPIRSRAFKKQILPFISISLLWGYAMLTGFSPSILRASTMFSIIIIGKALNRSVSIYNSIAFSAFVLLAYKPTYLFSVGFQLSYLAVLGIVYLHPKFLKIYCPQSWIGYHIWSILSASVAAQLATTPIGLLYFNQFPTYFLITNLIVIPVASVIMILGIAIVCTGHFVLSHWIGWLLDKTIHATNWVVNAIQHLPHSLIDWVYISTLESCLIYIFIFFTLFLEHTKNRIWYKYLYICLSLILISKLWSIHLQSQKNQIIVYGLYKQTLIDQISSMNATLFSIDSINNEQGTFRQVNSLRLKNYLKPSKYPLIFSKEQYLQDSSLCFKMFGKRRFLFVLKELENDLTSKINSDYLILERNTYQSVHQLKKNFDFDTLIISTSNYRSTTMKLQQDAAKLSIPVVVLKDQILVIDTKD